MAKESFTSQGTCFPVYQFLPKIAVKGVGLPSDDVVEEDSVDNGNTDGVQDVPTSNNVLQTALLLHRNYGQNLDTSIMRTDAFYALSELFIFSAFCENQFLNLIDHLISEEQNPKITETEASIVNL